MGGSLRAPPSSLDELRRAPPAAPPIDLRLGLDATLRPEWRGPVRTELPPDLWRPPSALPPRDIQQEIIQGLSRLLGEALHADELAGAIGHAAGRLGFDEADVTRRLRDLAQSGGEAAIRAALRKLIESLAGPPTPGPGTP
jgi:hypothetical protein